MENECKFPRLAKLAQRFLSVPATSIPAERTFSVAGLAVSNLRTNLDPDSVDQIIFLNKNLKSDVKKHAKDFLNRVDTTQDADGSGIPGQNITSEESVSENVKIKTESS